MNSLIKDYGLRFYVRDTYSKNAAKRGGEVFKPFYKKDLFSFTLRVKYSVNMSAKVIEKTSDKYPINLN